MEPHGDRVHADGVALAQELDGPPVDGRDVDVREVDLRLLAEHACDVGLEADPEANERLAEQLALLALLERLVELFVREQSLAQQERAELRAGLVVEELVVEACRPHRKQVSGFSTPNLREKRNPTFRHVS